MAKNEKNGAFCSGYFEKWSIMNHQIGDIVFLASGSPPLEIIEISGEDVVVKYWDSGSRIWQYHTFKSIQLSSSTPISTEVRRGAIDSVHNYN